MTEVSNESLDDLFSRVISWFEAMGKVFIKDKQGTIYHTYSAYARGDERGLGAFMYLDLTPNGRNEHGTMSWVKRHDEYDSAPKAAE